MLLQSKLISLAAIILLAALATPAAAGTLFKWTADDDSVSFTDDPKRIPERYRDHVETIQTGGLAGYRRYTPDDPGAVASYRERLAARLERLRESNAPQPSRVAPAAAGGPLSETLIKVNESTSVRVPTTFSDEGPIVVEEVRVRRKGSMFTIHDTVVRQGDRVLMVVRPAQPHQAGPNDFIDESELYE
jgi:hypothetical protein